MNVDRIQARLREFSAVRNWDQYHSPKILAMALSVEAAELEVDPKFWTGS